MLKKILIISLLLFSRTSLAALILTDWEISPGYIDENALIIDAATSLEWVRPDRYVGMTSASMKTWMSNGHLQGWRFAKEDEVVTLLSNFGFPGYDYSVSGAHSDPTLIASSVNALTDFLGADTVSHRSSGNVAYNGILGVIDSGNDTLGGFGAYTISISDNVEYVHYAAFCCYDEPYYSDTTSYFLVRESISTVPVPAAVWLFGSGLVGLIGMAGCRQKASSLCHFARSSSFESTSRPRGPSRDFVSN